MYDRQDLIWDGRQLRLRFQPRPCACQSLSRI